jgi:hypothetical protein
MREPVRIDTDVYQAACRIADMRGETTDGVVSRALRRYARGRTRPRGGQQLGTTATT